jgi:phage terminase small subunit
MARPKKATAILEATGAFEKNPDRKRHSEPTAEGEPVKPKFIKGSASRIWDEYAPKLVKMGTLKAVDSAGFATWCFLESEFQKEPSRMTAALFTQKRAYEERFGMSAGARAKLSVGDAEKKKDPAEKYFEDSDERSSSDVLQ